MLLLGKQSMLPLGRHIVLHPFQLVQLSSSSLLAEQCTEHSAQSRWHLHSWTLAAHRWWNVLRPLLVLTVQLHTLHRH